MDSVSDGSSESGRSAFSSDSLKEALEDLQMDTMCLLDLEPLLSDPIVLSGREPVRPDKCKTWQPTQIYCDKISARFPEADERLIQRLGNANYHRYLRCQETRRSAQSTEVPSNNLVKDNLDCASSKIPDSGIGSSLFTMYADTVMSYGDNKIRKVRLPPLPAHAKDGLPFSCVCCGKMVSVRSNSAWKQHIYMDLKPWVCLETDCLKGSEIFHTQRDWVSHLALDHGLESNSMSIKCPLCRHDTGTGKNLITKHLCSHLEEISLGTLPVHCDFEEEIATSDWKSLRNFPKSQQRVVESPQLSNPSIVPATLADWAVLAGSRKVDNGIFQEIFPNLFDHLDALPALERLQGLIQDPNATWEYLRVVLPGYPMNTLQRIFEALKRRENGKVREMITTNTLHAMIPQDWNKDDIPAQQYLRIDAICKEQDDKEERAAKFATEESKPSRRRFPGRWRDNIYNKVTIAPKPQTLQREQKIKASGMNQPERESSSEPKFDLSASPNDLTEKRQDSRITSEHDGKQNAELASGDPIKLQDMYNDLAFLTEIGL